MFHPGSISSIAFYLILAMTLLCQHVQGSESLQIFNQWSITSNVNQKYMSEFVLWLSGMVQFIATGLSSLLSPHLWINLDHSLPIIVPGLCFPLESAWHYLGSNYTVWMAIWQFLSLVFVLWWFNSIFVDTKKLKRPLSTQIINEQEKWKAKMRYWHCYQGLQRAGTHKPHLRTTFCT